MQFSCSNCWFYSYTNTRIFCRRIENEAWRWYFCNLLNYWQKCQTRVDFMIKFIGGTPKVFAQALIRKSYPQNYRKGSHKCLLYITSRKKLGCTVLVLGTQMGKNYRITNIVLCCNLFSTLYHNFIRETFIDCLNKKSDTSASYRKLVSFIY